MRLTCLFFTSPATLPAFLATEPAAGFRGDLYVELASRPGLAFALGLETPPHFPGLVGLLGGLSLSELSVATDRLSAPLVPAAGAPLAAAVHRAALAALRDLPGAPGRVTLLVHYEDAPALGAALHAADTFALAWDASAPPESGLLEFARWARAECMLQPGTFAGLLPYTARPLDAPAARHAARLARLFAETAPTLTAAQPELILPGA